MIQNLFAACILILGEVTVSSAEEAIVEGWKALCLELVDLVSGEEADSVLREEILSNVFLLMSRACEKLPTFKEKGCVELASRNDILGLGGLVEEGALAYLCAAGCGDAAVQIDVDILELLERHSRLDKNGVVQPRHLPALQKLGEVRSGRRCCQLCRCF